MPLDVLMPLVTLLVVLATAFAISVAIGVVVGRLGLREPGGRRPTLPSAPTRRPKA